LLGGHSDALKIAAVVTVAVNVLAIKSFLFFAGFFAFGMAKKRGGIPIGEGNGG